MSKYWWHFQKKKEQEKILWDSPFNKSISFQGYALSSSSYMANWGSVVTWSKVSKNVQIYRKNGTLITLGQNVTLKLDKNMGTKCHRHCDKPFKFSRSECLNLGWTDNRSALRQCYSSKLPQQTVCWVDALFGQIVMWSVHGWTDRQGTGTNYRRGTSSRGCGWEELWGRFRYEAVHNTQKVRTCDESYFLNKRFDQSVSTFWLTNTNAFFKLKCLARYIISILWGIV
jgi:hypothetical protein